MSCEQFMELLDRPTRVPSGLQELFVQPSVFEADKTLRYDVAMAPDESRMDWVDTGLDGLREEIDGHFACQNKELGELRREFEDLTRRVPSLLARWGLGPLPAKRPPRSGQRGTTLSYPSIPPMGLAWTNGRVADLQSHIRNASARASGEVAKIKDQIAEFEEEASERHFNRQLLLIYLSYGGVALSILLSGAVFALFA
jgi:hypothetical protein